MTDAFEWQGRVGGVWAEEWRLTDMSFAGLAGPLNAAIAALAPEHGRALDIGCGAGATSLALAAARPDLEILGVDLSDRLIEVARSRAKGASRVSFRVADVASFADDAAGRACFDCAFSRHGVMFFADPVAGFRGIRRLLRDDAALVFSCFAEVHLNPWAAELADIIDGVSDPALSASASPAAHGTMAAKPYVPGPFGFADPAFVREILKSAGFIPGEPRLVNYTYRAGEGPDAVAQALHFFQRIGPAARLLATIEPATRVEALERLRALLVRRANGGAVEFPAAAWIWNARAMEGGK